ncbi:MAG: histidine phosphatase family protein [Firmicutes bacterium]|nr:histidine phosphatase family protein [Bacillota bacterium]
MVYLIRHGETDGGQKGAVPLNEKGIAQTKTVAPKVAQLGITHIYSSDVMRAKQTTEIINETICVPVIFDQRLREFSGLEKISPEEFERNPEIMLESFNEAFERIKNFLSDLRRDRVDNVAIVTHRGIILTIMYAQKNDQIDFESFNKARLETKADIRNCQIIEFDLYT